MGDIIPLFPCDKCGESAAFILYNGYGVMTSNPRPKCHEHLNWAVEALVEEGKSFSVRKLPVYKP